jgi:hypothetical protein
MPRPVSKTGNEVTATIPNELEVIASLMDNALRIPGTSVRVGFDSIIGLIPGAGDLATSLVSLYIVSAAGRCGASRATQFRMALNIAIDCLVGAVPLIGDVFDVYWKSNLRNIDLLRRHLAASPRVRSQLRRRDRLVVFALLALLALVLVASVVATYFVINWIGLTLKHFVGR